MTVRAKPKFGQHFLEPTWVTKLLKTIQPAAEDLFVEIGPGRGAVTLPLAETSAYVVAIEIDRTLARELAAKAPANVTIIAGDVLNIDLKALLVPVGVTARAVGNLPYKISSAIVRRLLTISEGGARLRDATLMLQREVANRVTAEPGMATWGPLAVMTRLHSEAKRTLSLPPGAFRPVPRVRSTVIRLRFIPPRIKITDHVLFERLVRRIFTRRRKMALNALSPFAAETSPLPVEEIFTRAGVDPQRRPSHLKLSELAELSEVLASSRY